MCTMTHLVFYPVRKIVIFHDKIETGNTGKFCNADCDQHKQAELRFRHGQEYYNGEQLGQCGKECGIEIEYDEQSEQKA